MFNEEGGKMFTWTQWSADEAFGGTKFGSIWFLTNFNIGGKASTVEALTLKPSSPGFNSLGVAEVYQRCCLEESGP